MEYRRTKATVSLINYHFVFCPYRRRKIFDIPNTETLFKKRVSEICEKHGLYILAMECHRDHAHLFINAPPQMSPHQIMKLIKGGTSRWLRENIPQLSHLKQLWTRSYFCSTAGNVSSEIIKKYIKTQKTRS